MWFWILLACIVLAVGLLLYWAFIITEGAYLGARVVAWTYDLTARRYERIKQFNPLHDQWFLGTPMLQALKQIDTPLILDIATGTGRMPHALFSHAAFQGYVVGLDLSYKMLEQANLKLGDYAGRYILIWRDAQSLPFPDEMFDAVSCLEALEFMPSAEHLLSEMARVLRPGGILVVTNRINWESKLMPGKAFTNDEIRAMLHQVGVAQTEVRPWQVYYDLIWARKAGYPSRLGRGTWHHAQITRCPRCQHSPLSETEQGLSCPACDAVYPIKDHILSMTS